MSNAAKFRKKAVEYEQLKQFDRAVASYVRAIEESENANQEVDVALFNKVGDLTLRQGRVSEAVTYYERAVEHYVSNSLYDNAIALCNKILRNAPGRSNVYYTLGRICGRKGLRADATRNFLEYATRMQREGRLDEGMRALAEIADLMPELTEVRRLVEEHAERAGISLAPRRRNTPTRAAAVDDTPTHSFGLSKNLVFLEIDYDAVRAAREKTPPIVRSIDSEDARAGNAAGNSNASVDGAAAPVTPKSTSRLEDLMIFDPVVGAEPLPDDVSDATVVDGASILQPFADTKAPVESLVDLEPTDVSVSTGMQSEDVLAAPPPSADASNTEDVQPRVETSVVAVRVRTVPDFPAVPEPEADESGGDPVAATMSDEPVDVASAEADDLLTDESVADSVLVEEAVMHVSELEVFIPVALVDSAPVVLEEVTPVVPDDVSNTVVADVSNNVVADVTNIALENAPHNEDIVDEIVVDDLVVDNTGIANVVVDEIVIDDGAFNDDAIAVDNIAVNQQFVDEIEVSALPIEELALDELAVSDITIDDSALDHVALDNVSIDDIAIDDIAIDNIAIEEIAIDDLALETNAAGEIEIVNFAEPINFDEVLSELPLEGLTADEEAPVAEEIVVAESIDLVVDNVEPSFVSGDDSVVTSTFDADVLPSIDFDAMLEISDAAVAPLVDFTPEEFVASDAESDPFTSQAEASEQAELEDEFGLIGELPPLIFPTPLANVALPMELEDPLLPSDDLDDLFGDTDVPTAIVAAEATLVASSRCSELRAASNADPENFVLRRRLAEALFETSEREDAVTEMTAALASAELAGELADAAEMSDALVRVAGDDITHHQKRLELAIRIGDQTRLREAYLDLADNLVRRGEDLRAKAVYARVLEIDPWDDRALTALGDAAPPPPAKATVAGSDEGHVSLADWLRDDDEPASTRLRMREPDVSGDEQDDFNALLKHFKEGVARSLGEDDHESHYDLGVAYKEMGLLDDAIGEFQMALRGRSNRLAAYEALGQCFIEQESYKVAVTVLSRALHEPAIQDEQRVGVLYLLGISCEVLQRFDEARSYFQRVYATDIHFRDVGQRLADLERTVR